MHAACYPRTGDTTNVHTASRTAFHGTDGTVRASNTHEGGLSVVLQPAFPPSFNPLCFLSLTPYSSPSRGFFTPCFLRSSVTPITRPAGECGTTTTATTTTTNRWRSVGEMSLFRLLGVLLGPPPSVLPTHSSAGMVIMVMIDDMGWVHSSDSTGTAGRESSLSGPVLSVCLSVCLFLFRQSRLPRCQGICPVTRGQAGSGRRCNPRLYVCTAGSPAGHLATAPAAPCIGVNLVSPRLSSSGRMSPFDW